MAHFERGNQWLWKTWSLGASSPSDLSIFVLLYNFECLVNVATTTPSWNLEFGPQDDQYPRSPNRNWPIGASWLGRSAGGRKAGCRLALVKVSLNISHDAGITYAKDYLSLKPPKFPKNLLWIFFWGTKSHREPSVSRRGKLSMIFPESACEGFSVKKQPF